MSNDKNPKFNSPNTKVPDVNPPSGKKPKFVLPKDKIPNSKAQIAKSSKSLQFGVLAFDISWNLNSGLYLLVIMRS